LKVQIKNTGPDCYPLPANFFGGTNTLGGMRRGNEEEKRDHSEDEVRMREHEQYCGKPKREV
jgi:hypothetical protein